jgi:hypothetical protein
VSVSAALTPNLCCCVGLRLLGCCCYFGTIASNIAIVCCRLTPPLLLPLLLQCCLAADTATAATWGLPTLTLLLLLLPCSFVKHLRSSVGSAVHHHVEPHMPHSWAILPIPSMWPRQELIVQFIAEQATARGKAL